MILNKHQVFAADDLRTKVVDMTTEWGGDVKIKMMNAGEQLDFDDFLDSNPGNKEIAFKLIIKCCVDDEGKKLFTDEDMQFLKMKSSESLMKLFHEILSLNKQNKDDNVDLAKNS